MSPINSSSTKSSRSTSTRSRLARMLNRWTIFSVTSITMIVGSSWYAYEQSKLADATASSKSKSIRASEVNNLSKYIQDEQEIKTHLSSSVIIGVDPSGSPTTKFNDTISGTSQGANSSKEVFESGVTFENSSSSISVSRPANDKIKTFESSLGDYIIEAPDVLMIDVLNIVPKAPYQIQSGDGLQINVEGTRKGEPICGIFVVNPSGAIDFGSSYGKVDLKGKSVEAATEIINKHLLKTLQQPQVSLTVVDTPGLQGISGKFEVGPDGRVNLDKYGSVNVSGKTIEQAKAAIVERLSKSMDNPKVALDVYAMNSKRYYIITTNYGQNENTKTHEINYGSSDTVHRFPITGNDTVLNAIAQMKDLEDLSSKKIVIARPVPGQKENQILTVDWDAITKNGDIATNHRLLPNDRIMIDEAIKPWEKYAVSAGSADDQKILPLIRATDAITHAMGTVLFPWAPNGSDDVQIIDPAKQIVKSEFTDVKQVNGELVAMRSTTYADKSVIESLEPTGLYVADHYENVKSTIYRFKFDCDSRYETDFTEFCIAKLDSDITSKKISQLPGRDVSVIETTYKDGTTFYAIACPEDLKKPENPTAEFFDKKSFPIKEFGITVEELKLSGGHAIYNIEKNDKVICSSQELIAQTVTDQKPNGIEGEQEITVKSSYANGIELSEKIVVSERRAEEPTAQPTLLEIISELPYLLANAQEPSMVAEELELNMPEIDTEELAQIKLASYAEVSDEEANDNEENDDNVAQAFVTDSTSGQIVATQSHQPVRETDIPRELDQSKIIANPYATQTSGNLPQSPRPLIAEYKGGGYPAPTAVPSKPSSMPSPTIANPFATPVALQSTQSSAQKQVIVKFEVMEVSRTKLRDLGVDWSLANGKSISDEGIGAFIASPNETLVKGSKSGPTGDSVKMGFIKDCKTFSGFLNALKRNHLAHVKAEPTMTIMSGRPAKFNAGGEFPFVKPQEGGTATVTYMTYGTEINLMPLVMNDKTARLEMKVRLSEVDNEAALEFNGKKYPSLRSREIDTGMEVQVGQTAAFCGMPQTRIVTTINAQNQQVDTINEVEMLILVTLESIQGTSPADNLPVSQTAQAACHEGAIYSPPPQSVYPNPIAAQNAAYSNDTPGITAPYQATQHNAPAAAIASDESALPKIAQAVESNQLQFPSGVSQEDAAILNSIKRSMQIDVLKGNPLLSEGAMREGTMGDASPNPPMPLVDPMQNPDEVASDDDCPGSTPRTTQPRRIRPHSDDARLLSDQEIRLSSMNEQNVAPMPAPIPELPLNGQSVQNEDHSSKKSPASSKDKTLIATAKKLEALAYELDEESLYDQADSLRATAAECRAETRTINTRPMQSSSQDEALKVKTSDLKTPATEKSSTDSIREKDCLQVELENPTIIDNTKAQSNSEKPTLKMGVKVSKVLPNGDLSIDGEKIIRIDNTIQMIVVAGTISPKDVSESRTVMGNRISNLCVDCRTRDKNAEEAAKKTEKVAIEKPQPQQLRINDTVRIEIKGPEELIDPIPVGEDKLAMKMTVTIIDVQPNGNLVFEGIKKIIVDDELLTTSISGIVSPKDIPADRVVSSDKVINLVVNRSNEGIVRNELMKASYIEKVKELIQQGRSAINPF